MNDNKLLFQFYLLITGKSKNRVLKFADTSDESSEDEVSIFTRSWKIQAIRLVL